MRLWIGILSDAEIRFGDDWGWHDGILYCERDVDFGGQGWKAMAWMQFVPQIFMCWKLGYQCGMLGGGGTSEKGNLWQDCQIINLLEGINVVLEELQLVPKRALL